MDSRVLYLLFTMSQVGLAIAYLYFRHSNVEDNRGLTVFGILSTRLIYCAIGFCILVPRHATSDVVSVIFVIATILSFAVAIHCIHHVRKITRYRKSD